MSHHAHHVLFRDDVTPTAEVMPDTAGGVVVYVVLDEGAVRGSVRLSLSTRQADDLIAALVAALASLEPAAVTS